MILQGKERRDDERQKKMIRVPRAEEIEETVPEAPKETVQQSGYKKEGKKEGEWKTNYSCSATEVVMKLHLRHPSRRTERRSKTKQTQRAKKGKVNKLSWMGRFEIRGRERY